MTKKEQLLLKESSTKPDSKPTLANCVLNYLHKNGFFRTLKHFLKEAQIENDNWKASSLDLEDIYFKFLESSRDAETNVKVCRKQDNTLENDDSGLLASPEETIALKEKKKKSKKGIETAVATHLGVENKGKMSDCFSQCEHDIDAVQGSKDSASSKNQKDKKNKKKMELASQSIVSDENQQNLLLEKFEKNPKTEEVSHDDPKRASEESVKSKNKKEKLKLQDGGETTDVMACDSDAVEVLQKETEPKEKHKKKKHSTKSDNGLEVAKNAKSENGAKKETKKRKLSASDDVENDPIEKLATGESKRRKTVGLEEWKDGELQHKAKKVLEGNDNYCSGFKEENGLASQKEPQQLSVEQVDKSTKADLLMNGVLKSAESKSTRKQQNGSVEPTAVKAFQRVKVDEVNFADNRLQDNSYWAKDGAESGYGAKAQEVLGQVKGRDFRHEKTKKKRGSYRGGQIDLHSHSIKFNYSDEE